MFKPKTLTLIAALFASAALTSHPVHAQTQAPQPAGTAMSPGSTGEAGTASKLSRGDRDALIDMAQANMAEVETGKMALEKTQDPQVKQFAQMMIDDHTNGLKEVQQVADEKGVKLPTELDRSERSESKKLSKLSGAKFDQEYMKDGVSDHKKDHDKLEKISRKAKDEDVKQLAAKMLPVVDHHLDEAQKLSRSHTTAKL